MLREQGCLIDPATLSHRPGTTPGKRGLGVDGNGHQSTVSGALVSWAHLLTFMCSCYTVS